jgi:hypothetical protein
MQAATTLRSGREAGEDAKRKNGPVARFEKYRKSDYFFSISFLHSSFILSSALDSSIFLQASIFCSSVMAPPWEAAKAANEAKAKVEAIRAGISLRMVNLLREGLHNLGANRPM